MTMLEEPEEIEQFIIESDDKLNTLHTTMLDIDLRLRARQSSPTSVAPALVTPEPAPASSSLAPPSKVNMPKLQLPKFSGDLTEWTTFWKLFSSSIHDSPYFTNDEKFNYLKCNVTDEAKITIDIEGIAVTNEGYPAAVELLQKRFGQKHRIIEAYMTSLLNISKPRQGNVISLRRFYDHLESYIRSLSALGKNTDSYGSLLVPSLLDKMPAEVQMNLARTPGNREWNLDELRKAILTEVEILETCKTRPIFDISSSNRGTVTSLHTEVCKEEIATHLLHTATSPPVYLLQRRTLTYIMHTY